MADSKSGGNKLKNFFSEFTTHWSKPAPGKYVPYKEYLSVFIGGGGDYALQRTLGYLSFGTGCWLVVFYYQIPVLTFSIIGTFFMVQGYFWSIIGMIVNDNLGFLPKKTERIFNSIYAFFVVLGIVFLIFDFAKIIPFPRAVVEYFDGLPGLNLRSSLKIFAAHWVCTGYGGLRNIFIRKRWLKKLGRYKLFAYTNVLPCMLLYILICWLPLYNNPLTERVWQLYLLFSLKDQFGYTNSALCISSTISPNAHERMLVRCYPEKLSHLLNSLLVDTAFPIIAAYTGGLTNINTFRYIIPVMIMFCTVIMFKGLGSIQERIPQPPVEKKKYIPFWEGINGVMKNKYRWINALSGMIDALGNGTVGIQDMILIFTWREQGLVMVLVKNLIKFVGNPGAFLAPWIRKRFSFKALVVFRRMVMAGQSVGFIVACTVFKKDYFISGLIMLLSILICDALNSAIKLAQSDMDVRINDYQMYLSGERLEGYGGVVNWFMNPISALISLIIPILYYKVGYSYDYDILFSDDIRNLCIVIGVSFDLVGHILCALPYLLFWDYTDEKHEKVIKVLERREQLALSGASQEQIYAVTIDDVSETAVPAGTGQRSDE